MQNKSDSLRDFATLVASRRDWIETVLKPWCERANRRDLLLTEGEWTDLAGRADPAKTLWHWAWSRFPKLLSEGLHGMNETQQVVVTCHDGRTACGYPDSRLSTGGQLYLIREDGQTDGPFSIDDIESVSA
ncbi:MAG: hypothetical protein KDA80_02430 [Planctomycetaceae bacterium]|nr:hypothetical protein [Planctomycetaceae bacterium]